MNQDAFDMFVHRTLQDIDALYDGAGFENYQKADALIGELMEAKRRLTQIVDSIQAAQALGAAQ